jgi:hypothetical protein
MSAMDNLPGDQRAVLQLVLSRGRSYDEIARLLSINPDAVRERAVAALRTLGPQTNVDPEAQTSITDYLLGQLPEDQLPAVRRRLGESPGERAWARVVASELAPLASGPLPEIPTESSGAEAALDAPEQTPAAEPETPVEPAPPPPFAEPAPPPPTAEPAPAAAAADQSDREPDQSTPRPRSSRRGGLMVIGLVAAIIVVVVIILVTSGGGSKHPTSSAAASTSTTSASSSAASATTPSSSSSTTASTTSSGTSTAAKVVSQINLTPPAAGSKAAGIAEVLREGSTNGIAIVAQNVPPNTTTPPNAYAVWLYNSPTDAKILGFVNPGVPKSGKLSTAGGLPANASHYKQLIVTRETAANPKTPGTIILQGTLTGV